MHRTRVFILAAAFLAVALIVPPTIFLLATQNTIYNYIIPGNYPSQGATNSTNFSIQITPQQRTNIINSVIAAAIIEVVFLILFAVTLYYGINHTHPEHKPGVL